MLKWLKERWSISSVLRLWGVRTNRVEYHRDVDTYKDIFNDKTKTGESNKKHWKKKKEEIYGFASKEVPQRRGGMRKVEFQLRKKKGCSYHTKFPTGKGWGWGRGLLRFFSRGQEYIIGQSSIRGWNLFKLFEVKNKSNSNSIQV